LQRDRAGRLEPKSLSFYGASWLCSAISRLPMADEFAMPGPSDLCRQSARSSSVPPLFYASQPSPHRTRVRSYPPTLAISILCEPDFNIASTTTNGIQPSGLPRPRWYVRRFARGRVQAPLVLARVLASRPRPLPARPVDRRHQVNGRVPRRGVRLTAVHPRGLVQYPVGRFRSPGLSVRQEAMRPTNHPRQGQAAATSYNHS
jgi:hypothetical protein